MLDSWLQDVRYAARLLRRNPLFALTAAVSLAIGIGANTTIFTIANAADPAVVGRTIQVSGYPLTVIGVAPAGFLARYAILVQGHDDGSVGACHVMSAKRRALRSL